MIRTDPRDFDSVRSGILYVIRMDEAQRVWRSGVMDRSEQRRNAAYAKRCQDYAADAGAKLIATRDKLIEAQRELSAYKRRFGPITERIG